MRPTLHSLSIPAATLLAGWLVSCRPATSQPHIADNARPAAAPSIASPSSASTEPPATIAASATDPSTIAALPPVPGPVHRVFVPRGFVDKPEPLGGGITLDERATSDGFPDVILQRGTAALRIPIARNAIVMTLPAHPQLVLVDDCFVSNEDRLLVVDFSRPQVKTTTIDHEQGRGDYIHAYFDLASSTDDTLVFNEDEWAGTAPARHRQAIVALGPPLTCHRTRWRPAPP